MKKWYVVQVLSGQEKKIKKKLEESRVSKNMQDFIEEVIIPTENVFEIKKGQQKVMEKKLWPGYLFVKMEFNDDSWDYVKKVEGVVDFLGGKNPVSLSQEEIDNVLKELTEKEKGVVQKHKLEVGDKVKIVDGVFVNFIGTILEVFQDKGRLSVMVSIFGRDTRVDDLEFWQVEKIIGD